jgi:crossover junction endodeoxyribonuclease RuvC
MVVLEIDRGVGNRGYGVVVGRGRRLLAADGGVIGTPAAHPAERRRAILHERIADRLDEHGPDAVAPGALSFGQNVRAAFAVGWAVDYTPQRVTGAVCGAGLADRGRGARMVRVLLSLPGLARPDDTADAVAVAICHAHLVPLAAAAAAG